MNIRMTNPFKNISALGLKQVEKKYYDNGKKLFKGSIEAFIWGVFNNIHIETGMSAASLLPLAAQIRLKNRLRAAIAGQSIGTKKQSIISYAEWADQSEKIKSISFGEQLGRKAYTISWGSPSRPVFEFSFLINVFQYHLHEFGYARGNPIPWGSIEAGILAFDTYIEKNWRKYINADPIIKWLEGS